MQALTQLKPICAKLKEAEAQLEKQRRGIETIFQVFLRTNLNVYRQKSIDVWNDGLIVNVQ